MPKYTDFDLDIQALELKDYTDLDGRPMKTLRGDESCDSQCITIEDPCHNTVDWCM